MVEVFFDLDGTLTDSAPGIINAFKYMGQKLDLPTFSLEQYQDMIGPPLVETLKVKYRLANPNEIKKAISVYQEYYGKRGMFENTVYPHIPESLTTLKDAGYSLYIATAKPEPMAKVIVDHFGLSQYFDGVYGATLDEKTRSDKATILKYAINEINQPATQGVMVGDRGTDMSGATVNHLTGVGVLYGFGSRNELKDAGAKTIAKTTRDVPAAVEAVL